MLNVTPNKFGARQQTVCPAGRGGEGGTAGNVQSIGVRKFVTWSHSTYFGKPKITTVLKSFGEHIKNIEHNLCCFGYYECYCNYVSATVRIAYCGHWISEVAPMYLHLISKCVPNAGITDCKKIEKKYLSSTIGPTRCTIYLQFISIHSLYTFRALFCPPSGGAVCIFVRIMSAAADITRTKIYRLLYIQYLMMMGKKCSKHVEAINRNKLKVNSASCWSYYNDARSTKH
jgi:hypothetical protein